MFNCFRRAALPTDFVTRTENVNLYLPEADCYRDQRERIQGVVGLYERIVPYPCVALFFFFKVTSFTKCGRREKTFNAVGLRPGESILFTLARVHREMLKAEFE